MQRREGDKEGNGMMQSSFLAGGSGRPAQGHEESKRQCLCLSQQESQKKKNKEKK